MTTMLREYTLHVRLPAPTADDGEPTDDANVLRLCAALDAAGIDPDDWEFGETRDADRI